MKTITNLSNYLEEYSIYYLSKYSISKKKFEYILTRKVMRDFLLGKLSVKQKDESEKIIEKIVKIFVSKKIIKEELLIDNKISYLLSKGSSLKKIKLILFNDKFENFLINKKIKELKLIKDIDFKSLENFCMKKRLGKYNSKWDYTDKKIYEKTLSKLLREGFKYEMCKKFLGPKG